MLRVALCDGDENIINNLVEMFSCYFYTNNIIAEIAIYTNGINLLYDLQEKEYYDLVVLDIDMPDMKGIQMAREIKKLIENCIIIFLSSSLIYVIDAFEVPAFRYIPKSDMERRLNLALTDAIKMINPKNTKAYVICTYNRIEKVFHKDILFIQKYQKNSIISTIQGNRVKVRKSLAKVYSELNSKDFVFIERGCIANLVHIMKITGSQAYFRDGTAVQISKSHLSMIRLAINQFWEL